MTLVVESLTVRFGSAPALDGITLTVRPGERVGLIGPNGAGKTTLLNAIGGLVRPAAGRIRLDANVVSGARPDRVARLGVARTFESPRLFRRMTVEENIRAGRSLDAAPWLALTGLGPRYRELAEALTLAEGRQLELGRALAGRPRVLLLDEPCGGLTPAETDAMVQRLARGTDCGCLILLVEHKLGVIRRLCERVLVLHQGAIIFDGPTAGIRDDPKVLKAYLGTNRA